MHRSIAGLPDLGNVEIPRLVSALGATPPVTLTAAHVYPASAPAYESSPREVRARCASDTLRLYVHVPYCNYKCTFCHYATRVGDTFEQQERYVAALERELEWVEPGTQLSQLFMGGGTPTVLAPELLDRLLASIFERLPPRSGFVHTVEASPESVTAEHVRVLAKRGVARVSMGIQSLDDRVLDAVHRRHGSEQVFAACETVIRGGLILNVDLMYGLPRQSQESFRSDLETVANHGVHAVTLYDLRVKMRTPLGQSLEPAERLELENLLRWRAFVLRSTAELGFTQVRWHSFKRLDTIAARHERAPCYDAPNMQGYQLGIGMSARTHLGYTIYRNHERLRDYLERVESGASPVEQVFRLGEEDRRTQFIAATLGDGKPLERSVYARAFGRQIEQDFGDVLQRLVGAELIEAQGDTLLLSPLGMLVYDRVMLNFYPKHALDWLRAHAA